MLALLPQGVISPIASAQQPVTEACHLRVAWTEWKPVQYLDHKGRRAGLQFELIDKLGKKLGCRLTYIKGNWSQNLTRLKTGEADLMGNATVSAERQSFAWFSIPYRRDNFVVYFRAEDKDKYAGKNLQQLLRAGFRLGLTRHYLYGQQMDAIRNNPEFKQQISYASVSEDNFQLTQQQQIDGFLEDPFVIAFKLRSRDLDKRFVRSGINIEGMESCFIFSKASVNKALVDRFNRALRQLQQRDPLFQTIWFKR